MADPRFFEPLGPLSLNEIAALSGAAISHSGAAGSADTAAPLDQARPGALCYADRPERFTGAPEGVLEGVVLITTPAGAELGRRTGASLLTSDHPRAAFARAAKALFRPRGFSGGRADADVHASVERAEGVVVGEGAVIGEGVSIGPNAVIGPGVHIGAGSRIGAHAVILCADIGADCSILSHAVIGESGFGVATSPDGTVDIPHLGVVRIGDRVTVGAYTAIDRAVFGATVIGDGCRFDNHCHIAHNVRVGENCMMAAFAGVSGSTVIGAGVVFGGRVGVADHLTLGDGVQIGAGSAVMKDVPAGETWSGYPAMPIRDYLKQVAATKRLAAGRGRTRGETDGA